MAAVVVNDIAANPWVLAEVGQAAKQNVKVASFTYCEPASPAHVAELSDINGRLVARLDEGVRAVRFDGWVHGLTVDKLDSGYVIVALAPDR